MAKTLIDDSWIREISRGGKMEYTFCGALEYRYRHIAKNWNADTRKKHEREYNNTILPALPNHNEKSISEYTREDYENAIAQIKETGFEQNGVQRRYSDSSILNFQNLIYYVVYQSSVYGLCDDVLWGTRFELNVPTEREEIEARVFLKKSLSIEQEKRLSDAVMSNIDEDGAVVALLLMWGLGLRNAEACGLNYGDIKEIEGHQGCYAAWIYKSTRIDSNALQSGGKTYNTGRIVPVPARVYDFLMTRKERIKSIIQSQNRTDIQVDNLPICCNGWIDPGTVSYLDRCTANAVTSAAHMVFLEAGITSRQLAFLDAELSEGNLTSLLKEKEPTAYLMRRNYATQMCILGLSNAEMQYLIGHDVEDAYESRNEYVDSERIFSMHQKLAQRELLNPVTRKENKADIRIPSDKLMRIHISAKEPTDCISVELSHPDGAPGVTTKWYESVTDTADDRTVNILEHYHMRYNQ